MAFAKNVAMVRVRTLSSVMVRITHSVLVAVTVAMQTARVIVIVMMIAMTSTCVLMIHAIHLSQGAFVSSLPKHALMMETLAQQKRAIL